jgi:hypothetical protein
MSWQFTPEQSKRLKAPAFEDARADFAPYYSSKISEASAKAQIAEELGKLRADVLAFERGLFTVNGQARVGYLIRFSLDGGTGVIRVAGLPLRSPTETKFQQVRVQALLNVRDWLKSAVTMQVFNPDTSPLLPYMTLPNGMTVAEQVQAMLALPQGGE